MKKNISIAIMSIAALLFSACGQSDNPNLVKRVTYSNESYEEYEYDNLNRITKITAVSDQGANIHVIEAEYEDSVILVNYQSGFKSVGLIDSDGYVTTVEFYAVDKRDRAINTGYTYEQGHMVKAENMLFTDEFTWENDNLTVCRSRLMDDPDPEMIYTAVYTYSSRKHKLHDNSPLLMIFHNGSEWHNLLGFKGIGCGCLPESLKEYHPDGSLTNSYRFSYETDRKGRITRIIQKHEMYRLGNETYDITYY